MTFLVALDESAPGRAALEYALENHPDEEIVVVHVVDPNESGYGEAAHIGADGIREQRREQATALFERARETAAERDCEIETALLTGQPAAAVLEYATDRGVDRIVVGSHGRSGISRVLLGSVAERIARRSPVPVTIVR
ncbi:universal stress protein [Haloterrigena sp. SYSU A558-1]|uniref:Universal stress protein n=1 Tax=Haloterrigena gelatinilytica TaxID=2741724 RepID=A0A8J8GQI3_9EURY|nr:universal stress protein [Haloterrigena gelatinilytica]NUB93345.1 universal stress protein [Haloterrigena gelatinilytica]NUC70748.1 universal stress protein [Haloterrigena gelatinilytica]